MSISTAKRRCNKWALLLLSCEYDLGWSCSQCKKCLEQHSSACSCTTWHADARARVWVSLCSTPVKGGCCNFYLLLTQKKREKTNPPGMYHLTRNSSAKKPKEMKTLPSTKSRIPKTDLTAQLKHKYILHLFFFFFFFGIKDSSSPTGDVWAWACVQVFNTGRYRDCVIWGCDVTICPYLAKGLSAVSQPRKTHPYYTMTHPVQYMTHPLR